MFGSSSVVVVVVSATTCFGLWYLSLVLFPSELTDQLSQEPHSEMKIVMDYFLCTYLLTVYRSYCCFGYFRLYTAVVLFVEVRGELFTVVISTNLNIIYFVALSDFLSSSV